MHLSRLSTGGGRGWRLKCTQTVREAQAEQETCPMGVEGSAATNHRTGFSTFLLVKGQTRKRVKAASKLIKESWLWTSDCQAVTGLLSGLVMLCGLRGLALAAPTTLQKLPPKSAGHHTGITPIFKERTGEQ